MISTFQINKETTKTILTDVKNFFAKLNFILSFEKETERMCFAKSLEVDEYPRMHFKIILENLGTFSRLKVASHIDIEPHSPKTQNSGNTAMHTVDIALRKFLKEKYASIQVFSGNFNSRKKFNQRRKKKNQPI